MNAQMNAAETARTSGIQSLILLMQLLLPNTPGEKIQNVAAKTIDKSISLRRAMTEEQAIYRCYLCDNGEEFDSDWMEVATGEAPMGKIAMCTFLGLRRFTLKNRKREFIAVVKAMTKLEDTSHLKKIIKH